MKNAIRFLAVVRGLLFVTAALCFPHFIQAEVVARTGNHAFYRPYSFGMGYGGYGNYGGGTAAGNYLNGMSSVIAAQGQYNVQTSEAAINNEEARSKYIDNRKKWTANYHQMREEHDVIEAQKLARGRHSTESLDLAAKSGVPQKLGSQALDPVTGKITWPDVLQDDAYTAQRMSLDEMFELRAKTSHGTGSRDKTRAAIDELSSKLRGNIQNIPANDYMAARKFLDSLEYAAR
jgi:hypothetical protein